ncbi:MAG TPA: helix-hairpin-helix domain-containing protein [Bacillota bacterium]|nr:helix-hairpin-helix domain-containing protein [Bacillota bacterium]
MRVSASERLAASVLTVLLFLACAVWWVRQERVSFATAQREQERQRLLAELPSADRPGETAPVELPPALVVHVAGAVHVPGVYALPDGSRVTDALAAAGGATAAGVPHALNLAARLVDGERIWVPTRQEVAAGRFSQPVTSGQVDAKIDLNAAGRDRLETLPGIGRVKAEAIIAYREQHGKFTSVDDLLNVSGIGPATLERIRSLVIVR